MNQQIGTTTPAHSKFRRVLRQLRIGETRTFRANELTIERMINEIDIYTKSFELRVCKEIDRDNKSVTLTILGDSWSAITKKAVSEAKIGDVLELPIPIESQASATNIANRHAKNMGMRAVTRSHGPELLKIHLLDVSDQTNIPRASHQSPDGSSKHRSRKWELSDLTDENPSKVFEATPRDHPSIRNAAHTHAVRHGLRLSCEALPDGHMRVSKLSAGAPLPRRGPKPRIKEQYGFDTLGVGGIMTFDLKESSESAIRGAAKRYSDMENVKLITKRDGYHLFVIRIM